MLQRHRGRGLLPPSLRTSESFPSDLRSTRPKCANPRSVIVANLLQPIYRDHPRPAIKGSRGVSRPRRCFPRASRFPHVRALPFASTRSKPDRAKPRRFGDARLDRCRVRALLRCAQILGDHLRRSLAYRTRTDAHVVEHALAQRADGRLAHWGSCLEGWSACPPRSARRSTRSAIFARSTWLPLPSQAASLVPPSPARAASFRGTRLTHILSTSFPLLIAKGLCADIAKSTRSTQSELAAEPPQVLWTCLWSQSQEAVSAFAGRLN
jgi:hypothetical protein